LVSLPYGAAEDVAVNGSYVYWINGPSIGGAPDPVPDGSIGRANLDGSGVVPDLINPVGSGFAQSLAVDGSHVYWTDNQSIGRANLGGNGVDQNFIPVSLPVSVAAGGGYVYWTTLGAGAEAIGRAYVGGGAVNPGVDPDFIPDPEGPTNVAVAGSHLYWANEFVSTSPVIFANAIGRANLDGSEVNESFITDPNDPISVAVSTPTPGLVLSAPSIAADGRSTSTATMLVSDQFGNPVSGDHPAITSSDPSQQVGTVTNPTLGMYQATITSTTTPGTATITGTDGPPGTPLTATATLTQTGPPAHVAVVLAPASILANGSSTAVATATVTDQGGNPLNSQTVTFASSGGQSIGPVSSPGPGMYQATITSTKVAGTATITASDSTPSTPLSGTAKLTQPAGTATLGTVRTNGTTALVPVSSSAGGPCPISLALEVSETLSRGKVIAVTANAKRPTHRAVSVGGTNATIAAGASETVKIALNKAGRALYAGQRHHLAVKLTLTQTGTPATTRTVTFKGPPAPGVAAGKVSVAKSKVTVRYALTAAAKITLSVAPAHGHATVVAHAKAHAGVKDQITWNRKLHGKTAKPGKYKLTLTATAGGLSSHSTVTIRL
jgi:hypothetical protein